MFFMPFRIDILSIFDLNLAPTWLPKSRKIHEKSMVGGPPMLNSFFDRFLIDFWLQLGPPEPQKSSSRCSESTIFKKIGFRTRHQFLINFGTNLASFSMPKTMKIHKKTDFKRLQKIDEKLDDFGIDFSWILASSWDPTWSHVGLQDGPRRQKSLSKTRRSPSKKFGKTGRSPSGKAGAWVPHGPVRKSVDF